MYKHVADYNVDDFYYLSRSILVKDERNLDKFDKVFGHVSRASKRRPARARPPRSPRSGCVKLAEKLLTRRRRSRSSDGRLGEADGDAEKRSRSNRSATRAAASGSAPPAPRRSAPTASIEGVRIGQDKNREGRAVKVWDKREYKNSTTPSRSARATSDRLRRLRKFAREAPRSKLDMPDTIPLDARNAAISTSR